jgi:hypothetical protein
MTEDKSDLTKELSYDLRQVYATLILGKAILSVDEARDQKNYELSLTKLRRWYIVSRHNFKKPQEEEKEYQKLINNCLAIANKYRGAFLGLSTNKDEIGIVEYSLDQLELFLYRICEEANLFGGKIERDPSKIIGSSR